MRIEMPAFYKTFGNYILLATERYIVHIVRIVKSIPNNVFLVLSLFYSISISIAVWLSSHCFRLMLSNSSRISSNGLSSNIPACRMSDAMLLYKPSEQSKNLSPFLNGELPDVGNSDFGW